ncbi:bzip transcription factor, partial [Lasius niger]
MVQNEFTRTRGNSTECTTTEPETMQPPDTSEFMVMPWLPERSCTNLAGGSGSMFPAPSPNSQALFAQLAGGGATPSTLDFHRTALSAAAKREQA